MKNVLLEASNLRKSFVAGGNDPFSRKPEPVVAVHQLSMTIEAGETLGIAGESGCGKSTLAKMLTGLLKPDSGKVFFEGEDLALLDKARSLAFRRSVQMVFQDPFSSLNPRMRVGDIISEPLQIHGLADGAGLKAKTIELMEQVGLSADYFNRFPHEFSGGQRQRIGIARALAVSPRLLVADEPVSSLDISIQAQIINLLKSLKDKHNLTMAVVSHDLSVLRHISSRIAIMYLGEITETAPAPLFFSQCRHPYSEALLSAIPRIGAVKQQLRGAGVKTVFQDSASNITKATGCRFAPRCPYAKEICRIAKPELREVRPGHQVTCHLSETIYP